ncbi:cellobiose dehydrogenase [Colletotrichum chrysophilum]|uniref:Cellobiose dehydrogenase n=1 Tax=Colletotrichum chrysophilum TaxID=1836956 RepID=A0AAD9EGU4_9PEZI|nr:cellobiose dehydrogenase [Colletotrichum chrysophilum]
MRILKYALLTLLTLGLKISTAECTSKDTIDSERYDYIVVGAGAGGMPMADRLSEAGHKVLMIERGPISSGRWFPKETLLKDQLSFDNWRPEWLKGTNLTRFDVPGLCQRIWVDGKNVTCDDINENTSGCVLGGGMAVNAGLWWKSPDIDWDQNYPEGWKAADMKVAADALFKRIPATDRPSTDGVLYAPEGYNVLSRALKAGGWNHVNPADNPNAKSQTFAFANFMYQNGERHGPLATYLVTANSRPNFKMWTNTMARRVIRDRGRITGVEIESRGDGGRCGIVNVTESTGRVVISGGYYGTPKLLFRSGIGPEDQLRIVQQSTDGPDFIEEPQWIKLPVGRNLHDHTVTDLQITHKDVNYYDFQIGAWESPIQADVDAYLKNRSGMLTMTAPNDGPIMWEVVDGPDGPRQFQYTARVAGATKNSMTISQFLGRGGTSVGAVTINPNLTMSISTLPYQQTKEDKAAIIASIKNLMKALSTNPDIVLTHPPANMTVEQNIEEMPVNLQRRRGLHYLGTAKMGIDSGLEGGTSVVDTHTRVYGTENLFIVDASIMPGMVTTNPSGPIMTVAERAAQRILELQGSILSGGVADVSKGAQKSLANQPLYNIPLLTCALSVVILLVGF